MRSVPESAGTAENGPESGGTPARTRTAAATIVALGLLLAGAGVAQEPATREPVPESGGTSGPSGRNHDRSTVRLRYDCRSEIGRRELTLFANGTVRLREGLGREERFELGELSPEELTAFENRLAEIDLAEDDPGGRVVVDGPWMEQCRLDLLTMAERAVSFSFSKAATRSLSIDRLTRMAEELAGHVRPELGGDLPAGYQPVSGDELVRADGRRFRVVALTSDGKAVELEQIDEPLVIFVPVGELRNLFIRREPRR